MNAKKHDVTFTYELKQGAKGFYVKCLDWVCVITQGENYEQSRINATDATELFLELLAEGKLSDNQIPKIRKRKQKDNRFNLSFSSPFVVTTKEELLTLSYGPKGTKRREQAETKIKDIAKNISFLNKLKEDQPI
jgi:predicted RNase H-like HicB family nuclease